MNHHTQLLSNLGIDPESEINLHYIEDPRIRKPRTGQFQPVNESNKIVYQLIVKHFLEKHLYSFEIDSVLNGFQRSQVSLDALYEDTFKAQQVRTRLEIDDNMHSAIQEIQDAFRPRKPVHILHYADTRLYPWPLRSNIERPYSDDPAVEHYLLQKFNEGSIPDRKACLHNLYDYVYEDLRPKIHLIKEGKCFNHDLHQDFLFPMTAHVRPGLGKSVSGNMKIKNRLVYGVSKTMVIPSAQFYFPLFREYLDSGLSPLLWGYETLNGGWQKLRTEMLSQLPKSYFIFSGDWSQFDHRVLFELMNIILVLDQDYFNWEEYQPTEDYPFAPFNKDKMQNLYNWLIYATFSSPLVMPDGKIIMRVFAALASGMFSTQYIDSKVNGIMLLTIFKDAGFQIDAKKMLKLMGDDNFAAIWRWLPPNARQPLFDFLSERAKTRFNAILSVDASEFHDSLNFVELLGYRNFNGFAYRDHLKLLAQLFYPESNSFHLSSLKARCIGILYASLDRNARLRRICEDIFEYLESENISTNKRSLMHMFDPNVYHNLDLIIDRLPTTLEIQRFTAIPKQRSPADIDRYWPSKFFIDPEDIDRRLAAAMRRMRFSINNKI
jgi:hypothetical protein